MNGGLLQSERSHAKRKMNRHDIEKVETFTNLVSVTLENILHHNHLETLVEERTRDLREAESRLVQSERMAALGNLVAGIAHEINNPIAAVNSNVDVNRICINKIESSVEKEQTLEQVRASKGFQRSLKILKENNKVTETACRRVVAIIKSLKSFARLDEAEFKEMDLHEGIDSTLTLLHHELKNRIEVVKEYGWLTFLAGEKAWSSKGIFDQAAFQAVELSPGFTPSDRRSG